MIVHPAVLFGLLTLTAGGGLLLGSLLSVSARADARAAAAWRDYAARQAARAGRSPFGPVRSGMVPVRDGSDVSPAEALAVARRLTVVRDDSGSAWPELLLGLAAVLLAVLLGGVA